MTSRYGIFIVPEPEFTARAYRARQIICGQYGAWAAEMLMVHIMLAGFFPLPESSVEPLTKGLADLAADSRGRLPRFPLNNLGVATAPESPGTIFLDFTPLEPEDPLRVLYTKVADLIDRVSMVSPRQSQAAKGFHPRLPLLQYANLPATLFDDAMEFAGAVVNGLALPGTASAWRVILARFQSQAAGENWEAGSWAADISWELLSSHPL